MTPPQTALSRAQDHLNGKGPYLLADADIRALVAVVESLDELPLEAIDIDSPYMLIATVDLLHVRAALRAATASGEGGHG